MVLANQIEESINCQDPTVINGAFHLPTFMDRFVMPNEFLPSTLKKFNSEFVEGFSRKFDFGSIIIKQLDDAENYRFLRQYSSGETHHMIFRLFADEGLNYHDYELKVIDNEIKIIDVYIYMTGENFSETLRRLYLSTLNDNNKEEKLGDVNEEYLYSLALLKEIRSFLADNNLEDAMKLFGGIPLRFRKEKMFQIMNIQIAKNLDDEQYIKAIENYQNLFPNDPSLNLIGLDGYFLKGHFVKSLQMIEELEGYVGNDPILNLYRGNVYFTMGDVTSSIECFKNLTIKMPEFELGHLGLLNSYIEGYRYNESLKVLDTLLLRFKYKLYDLMRLMNEFKDFRISPHYKEWLGKWG